MKKFLKWAGIVLGVLLLVFLIAAPFLMGAFFHGRAPMMGGFRPSHHSFGMLWFGMGLFFIGRVLFPLLVAGLLVWGGYLLGRSAGRREKKPQIAPAAQPVQAPAETPPPPEAPADAQSSE